MKPNTYPVGIKTVLGPMTGDNMLIIRGLENVPLTNTSKFPLLDP